VTSMKSMFMYASAFNQDLRAWSVQKVRDCQGMMAGTAKQAKRPKFRFTTKVIAKLS